MLVGTVVRRFSFSTGTFDRAFGFGLDLAAVFEAGVLIVSCSNGEDSVALADGLGLSLGGDSAEEGVADGLGLSLGVVGDFEVDFALPVLRAML